jgi:hypothetical protein
MRVAQCADPVADLGGLPAGDQVDGSLALAAARGLEEMHVGLGKVEDQTGFRSGHPRRRDTLRG